MTTFAVPAGATLARALLDTEDRLTAADAMILALNAAAGGRMGEPLALPQLAAVPRLARRLGIPVAREVLVADEAGELTLRVRAEPVEDGTSLTVGGWRDGPAPGELALLDGRDGWRWDTDAALRLTVLAPASGCADRIGSLLTDLFSDDGGQSPFLDLLSRRGSIEAQPARLATTGAAVLLTAVVRRDARGGFAGLSGVAELVATAPAQNEAATHEFLRGLNAVLRAPLARIVANADSIAAEANGPVGRDYANYAADIASAGRHLMALVDDLRDLDAVDRGAFGLHVEPIDLADAGRRAAGLLAVRAANGGVAVQPPDGEAMALGDFRRVLQILVNLIGNALRYSPGGSAVTLSLARVSDRQRIMVTDRGKGIAPADQARIFDKFERVDPAEPGGSGLGLYIARRLARAMGGDLTVESAPGAGARFTLELPAAG